MIAMGNILCIRRAMLCTLTHAMGDIIAITQCNVLDQEFSSGRKLCGNL